MCKEWTPNAREILVASQLEHVTSEIAFAAHKWREPDLIHL